MRQRGWRAHDAATTHDASMMTSDAGMMTPDAGMVEPDAASPSIEEAVQTAITTQQDYDEMGVGVGVVSGGELIFARGYGLRDRARDLPFDENTLFAISSTTKAFTAFSLMQLAESGALDLHAQQQVSLIGATELATYHHPAYGDVTLHQMPGRFTKANTDDVVFDGVEGDPHDGEATPDHRHGPERQRHGPRRVSSNASSLDL